MIAWRTWPWWCKLLAIGGAVIAITVVSFATWFFSDADLRRVEERAKAMGVATTWEEFGVVMPPEESLLAWETFSTQTKAMEPWLKIQGYDKARLPTMGESPPPSLVQHAFGIARTLAEAIDGLPPTHLIPEVLSEHNPRIPKYSIFKNALAVQAEVVLSANAEDVHEAARRLYRIAESQPYAPSLLGLVVHGSSAHKAREATAIRHDSLSINVRRELSERLDAMAVSLEHHSWLALHGEFLEYQQNLADPHFGMAMIGANFSHPRSLQYVSRLFTYRCSRGPLLVLHLDLIAFGSANRNPKDFYDFMKSMAATLEGDGGWNPSAKLPRATMPYLDMAFLKTNQVRSQLILTARLLREEDPGVDPIIGEPYRRFERDGEPVGWYSPGLNGDDAGDERKDWCVAWEQPWQIPARPILSPPVDTSGPTLESMMPLSRPSNPPADLPAFP